MKETKKVPKLSVYKPTSLTPTQLTAVLEALEEVKGAFEFVGFRISQEEESDIEPAVIEADNLSSKHGQEVEAHGIVDEEVDGEQNEEKDDDYSDYFSNKEYDSEDIEVALSEFVTQLSKRRLIRKNAKGRLPCFSEAFAMLFGTFSQLAKTARRFEEYVEGYFGSINYKNMSDAHAAYRKMADKIERMRDAGKREASSGRSSPE